MKLISSIVRNLSNPLLAATAVRVSLVIGTLLLLVNHGTAILSGQMSRERWIAALLTYLVPYCVSIHGQTVQLTQKTSSNRAGGDLSS